MDLHVPARSGSGTMGTGTGEDDDYDDGETGAKLTTHDVTVDRTNESSTLKSELRSILESSVSNSKSKSELRSSLRSFRRSYVKEREDGDGVTGGSSVGAMIILIKRIPRPNGSPLFDALDADTTIADALRGRTIVENPELEVCLERDGGRFPRFIRVEEEGEGEKVTTNTTMDQDQDDDEDDGPKTITVS